MTIQPRIFFITLLFVFLLSPISAKETSDEADLDSMTISEISENSVDIVEKALRSVVQIEVVGAALTPTAAQEQIWSRFKSSGSGFIVDPSGYIVTNAHVVKDAQFIQVILPDKTNGLEFSSIVKGRVKPERAQLIGLDEETDIAVLKIERSDMPALEISDSDKVKPGDLAWAIGSPLGLNSSVTMGIVSTNARQLEADHPMIYIQTDVAVNPGSSGGPLIGSSGKVIGVNASILTKGGGSDGISLSVPSNIVQAVYTSIREHGYVRRGDIGVNAQTITPEMQEGLGLDQDWGVILSDSILSGPAFNAGLRPGDQVLRMDGKLMENGRQFIVNLYGKEIGSSVALDVVINGSPKTVNVEVKERRGVASLLGDGEKIAIPHLGIIVADTEQKNNAPAIYKRGDGGVIIKAKLKNANNQHPQIRTGDIIYSLNKSQIFNVSDLLNAVLKLKVGDPVVLHIERNRKLSYVTFYWV